MVKSEPEKNPIFQTSPLEMLKNYVSFMKRRKNEEKKKKNSPRLFRALYLHGLIGLLSEVLRRLQKESR